jgi:hypothetical protein
MRRATIVAVLGICLAALLVAPGSALAAAPAGPTGVTTSVEGMNIRVGWAPPADLTGVTGYRVTTSPDGPSAEVPVGADHAVLTGVRPNTSYIISVMSLAGDTASDPALAPEPVQTQAPGGSLHPIAPVRLLDTRSGLGAPAGLTNSVSLQITGVGGIAATGVGSVLLNVTVTGATASGFVTAYPSGLPRPTSSNLNYVRGQTSAVLVVVPVGADGKVILYSLAKAHLIADAAGWFSTAAAASPATGLFHGLAPARLMDTRTSLGGQTPGGGATVDLQVTGSGGVPATGVSAVVLNLVTAGSSASGYVTAYPTGATRPLASTLNFVRKQVVANRVIVPVGTGGKVSFYNFGGLNPLVVDVTGWFGDGSDPGSGGAYLAGVSPSRIVDTRSGLGAPEAPLGAATALGVAVAGHAGVPAAASTVPPTGVIASVTAIAPTSSGYLTVYPSLTSRPTASDLNFTAGAVVPALVVGRLGTDGGVEVFNSAGKTNIVIDVFGYFVGDTAVPSTTHTPPAAQVLNVTGPAGGTQTVTLAAAADVPPIGDIVVAGVTPSTPDGLLVQVTGATTDGTGNHVLTVEPASLQDAVGNGSFSLSAALSDSDIQGASSGTHTLTPSQLQRRLNGDEAVIATTSPVSKLLSCSGGGSIEVTGGVSVTPSFDFSVGWGWFKIKSVTFTGTLSEDASMSATAQEAASCSVGPVELLPEPIRFTPITIEIGPVPVVITPELQFELSAKGSVSAEITTSASQHASGTLGLRFDGSLHPIASTESDFTYTPPTPTLEASVSASLGPRIDLFLYGVAGPYLTAAAGVRLDVTPLDVPAWKLTGTLDAGAGIAFPKFHFDKSNPSILHFEKVLAEAEVLDNGTNTDMYDLTASSSNNVWAVGATSAGGDYHTRPIAEQWSGSSWRVTTLPLPGSSIYGVLASVATTGPDDVWVGGAYYDDNGGNAQTLLEHWDGTSWSILNVPAIASFLYIGRLVALSPTDLWVFSGMFEGSSLAAHWDDVSWTVVPGPPGDPGYGGAAPDHSGGVMAVGDDNSIDAGNPTAVAVRWNSSGYHSLTMPVTRVTVLTSVTMINANDGWAVGQDTDHVNHSTVAMHWNGATWQRIPIPDTPTGLYDVSGAVSNDVWAVSPGGFDHWDGTQWSAQGDGVASAIFENVEAVSPDDVWATGVRYSSGARYPIALHWDGLSWTQVGIPAPVLP